MIMETNQIATQNETAVWWEVQGFYPVRDRWAWRMVTAHDTRPEAVESLDEYEENEPEFQHRIKRVRGQGE
jgi:hypothetical protein